MVMSYYFLSHGILHKIVTCISYDKMYELDEQIY